MNKMQFKRNTLIENIEQALARAQQEELPATIKEVQAFGGILRDKEKAHDFDAVFLIDQTPEQAQIWDRFRRNFNNAIDENRELSRQQLHDLFQPYYRQGLPFSRVVMTKPLCDLLEKYGIKPLWAACFSWTDFYFSFLGIFYPDINKVMRKLILKGSKGIQAIFENYEEFKRGHTMLIARNFQLAWSPERSDIKKNLQRSKEEKIAYLASELNLFQTQLVSLQEQLSKLMCELVSTTSDTDLKLNFEELNSTHPFIVPSENETYRGLLLKCEQARQEMRTYNEEICVLRHLTGNIENFKERLKDTLYPLSSKYSMKELVTSWTLSGTPKYEVKEARIREILNGLGLPENHVITIQRYGAKTDYRLGLDKEEREKFLAIAEKERNRNKYLKPLNRVAKRFDKDFYVEVELAKGKPTSMTINYSNWCQDQNEDFRKTISSKLRNASFDVELNQWSIQANKIVIIDGKTDVKQLATIVEKALEKFGR